MTPQGVRRTRVTAVAVGAFAVVLVALAAVAFVSIDARFQVVRPGSGTAVLDHGSVVVSTPVDAARSRAGDLVTVRADGTPVTGRVVTATSRGDETELVLAAGAPTSSAQPAQDVYVVREADRVTGSVPYLGYVVDGVTSPVGLVGLGVLFVLLTLLSPALPERAPLPGGRHRGRRSVVPQRSSIRSSLD